MSLFLNCLFKLANKVSVSQDQRNLKRLDDETCYINFEWNNRPYSLPMDICEVRFVQYITR